MAHISGFINDGFDWPGRVGLQFCQRLLMDCCEGVQLMTGQPIFEGANLPHCGLDRIDIPAEADAVAAKHFARGDQCITVHVDWGLEDDDEVLRLVDTHRTTITQDMWRTVQTAKTFSEIRSNGDFSHYYCGQKLVYGDLAREPAFMEPIFERTDFLHGWIANPGCMQVPSEADSNSRPLQAHRASNYLDLLRRYGRTQGVDFFAPPILAACSFSRTNFRQAHTITRE